MFPHFEPKGVRLHAIFEAHGVEVVFTNDIKKDPNLLRKVKTKMRFNIIKMVTGNTPKSNSKESPNSAEKTQPCGENNTERVVICSGTICDYCENKGCKRAANWCGGFEGRKLSPIS